MIDKNALVGEILESLKEVRYILNNIKLGNRELHLPRSLQHYAVAMEYGITDLINLTEEELSDNN